MADTQRILSILQDFRGVEALRTLFWVELNYERADILIEGLPEGVSDLVAEAPLCFATAGRDADFSVIYVRLKTETLRKTDERRVVTHLQTRYTDALYVFSDVNQEQWHFINVKFTREKREKEGRETKQRHIFRRIRVGPYERLRTAAERVAMLDLQEMGESGLLLDVQELLTALHIRGQHEEAFNVEAVTAAFFEEFKGVFKRLQTDLKEQTGDDLWAHDYALQFLSRCLFLYFIQRKRWLGDDTEFLRTFWETYQESGQPRDSFVCQWLNVLFFEAFNNRFHGGHSYFPRGIREILQLAPYLNGGLFRENELDTEYVAEVSDDRWAAIFSFFEKYNFTIAEDTPLDQEVAVDPEMIGKVYESLVSAEDEEQGDAGIFYTPRVEIDLMCRLALVDNLANHIGSAAEKTLLYEALFAFEPEEKAAADEQLSELWAAMYEHLTTITIVDPACGSGSFLVGMLHVLDDIQERAEHRLDIAETAVTFGRKKSIIGKNLYGVDVKKWACKVAELRLWLALIIDADIPTAELNVRQEPLLPDFSFNIRHGDSIVQNIGGMNLAQTRDIRSGVPSALRRKISEHQTEKLRFYNSDSERKYAERADVETAECGLFRELMQEQSYQISKNISRIKSWLEDPAEQLTLDGMAVREPRQLDFQTQQKREELAREEEKLAQVERARAAIAADTVPPFAWDIAFVEIFEQRGGFDIVIENPPYIRQEGIRDLTLPREVSLTPDSRRGYKAKLARAVYQTFPKFFGYQEQRDTRPTAPENAVKQRLPGRSDLYVYFYFHGISLLNPKGTFCSITSNSWLDTEFGANLKEFLLTECRLKLVIDNMARRSFQGVNINTIITLTSAAYENREENLKNTTRFINFTVPFEAILDPIIFYEIETASGRMSTQEHKINPLSQRKLLAAGTYEKDRYTGESWGGKYLRSPDIYQIIFEKGKRKLLRIGEIADVRLQLGIKTGVNKFFIPNQSTISAWRIEAEFLKPLIADLQESPSILIDPDHLPTRIFMCPKEKSELRGTAALAYIEWGETQGFHEVRSCKGRPRWYDVGKRPIPHLNFPRRTPSTTSKTFYTRDGCYALDKFVDVNVPTDMRVFFCYYLNSTLFQLMVNVNGRSSLGYGALEIQASDLKRLLCIDPKMIDICVIDNVCVVGGTPRPKNLGIRGLGCSFPVTCPPLHRRYYF